MVAPLSAADRQSVIDQAIAIGQQQGIDPRLALWNYAQSQGLSPSDVDVYMGLQPGETQNWAVSSGVMAAPQGNFNPTSVVPPAQTTNPPSATSAVPAAESPVQPLSAEDKASVLQQAQTVAQQQGITPEQALYNYAQNNNISTTQVDSYMGWPTGTTQSWAVQNGQNPAPQGNYTFNITNQVPAAVQQAAPAPAKPPVTPLDATTRQSVIQQAQAIAGQQNISPEQALYNYAQTNGIPNADVDTYMGWPAGTTSAWANKTTQQAPIKSASELAASVAPSGVYGLDPTTRASIVQQAQDIASKQGISPEMALYNYARANNISNANVDTYMGWDKGTVDAWAQNNLPKPSATPPAQTAPLAQVPSTATHQPAGPLSTASYQPQYRTPTFNALYQNQQQAMTVPAPQFNFQSQQPEQPGALTNVISAP